MVLAKDGIRCCVAMKQPQQTLSLESNTVLVFMVEVEYKFAVLEADGTYASAWQSGNNSVLAVQAGEETLEVFDNW